MERPLWCGDGCPGCALFRAARQEVVDTETCLALELPEATCPDSAYRRSNAVHCFWWHSLPARWFVWGLLSTNAADHHVSGAALCRRKDFRGCQRLPHC